MLEPAERIANINREKLTALMDLVLDKNKELNITSITNKQEFWQKHIIDSLKILEIKTLREMFGNFAGNSLPINVIDVGTGGGFPGLPLAIVCQEYFKSVAHFTLIDSRRKKTDAVNSFINSLNLKNAETIWTRSNEHKNKYDLVLARSVANFPELVNETIHLSKPSGLFGFYKAVNPVEQTDFYSIKLVSSIKYSFENKNMRAIYIFSKFACNK